MSLTVLDPNTALIIIDLQKGIVSLPTVHPSVEIINNVNLLLDAFHQQNLPVVIVNVDGRPIGRTERALGNGKPPENWSDLIPELRQQPDDKLITKYSWGAFTNTGLENILEKLGVTQIVIAGIATSAGVESTARYAHELGFNVTLAIDAMTDIDREAHDNSIKRIFPRIGETGTVADILELMRTING